MTTAKPTWVEEAEKEIKRLNRKISEMQKVDSPDAWEDINNWTGWRDGIAWTLKMREGKTTRQEAWGI